MTITLDRVSIHGHQAPIELHPERSTIEINVSGGRALLAFERSGNTLALTHTEVPLAMRGKGIGTSLARAALDYARQQGWTVLPYCPFVAAFIEREPAYQDLVDPTFAA